MKNLYLTVVFTLLVVGVSSQSIVAQVVEIQEPVSQLFCFTDHNLPCSGLQTDSSCKLTAGEVVNNALPITCGNFEISNPGASFRAVLPSLGGKSSAQNLGPLECVSVYKCRPRYFEDENKLRCTVREEIDSIDAIEFKADGDDCESILTTLPPLLPMNISEVASGT